VSASAELAALRGRRVVLGVAGGIAAYKAVEICRRLVDAGAHVSPVLTEDATRFIGTVTFSALASEPAATSLFDGPDPIPHTRLGQSADLVVVAPATAKLLGKYAAGISDDLLTATLLATRAPVLVAPAMHTEMWEHAAVQENLVTLRRRGVHVVDPESGRLAGGDVGAGRLADPARIVVAAAEILSRGRDLAGLRVLVTAGGTREAIDPVRFVGNRSSGKMGFAIAAVAASRGAAVTLVCTRTPPASGGTETGAIETIRVETAEDMYREVLARFPVLDVVVMAAAVADFRPKAIAPEKLKKRDGLPEIVLEPTPDILGALGASKTSQLLVGFAAETERVEEHAAEKLAAKRLDLIVANDVSAPDAGFEVDTNRAVLLDSSGSVERTPLLSKAALAGVILDRVATRLGRGVVGGPPEGVT
jgi:phosphopantothenoylcysteine decarboxylase / phosphopantothenate---cysteine ligase